jgi:mono/diheme cytochrome c family protein
LVRIFGISYFEGLILTRVKGFRIAAVAAAVVAGFFVVQFAQGPVDVAAAQSGADAAGAKSYAEHCAVCHGDQREGNLPAFPPLAGIGHRMSADQLVAMVHTGKGRMPGFPDLKGDELTALVHFLSTTSEPATAGAADEGEAGDEAAKAGGALFRQNCAFCHGRDAMGGETGPDLTASKLVKGDKTGEVIAGVIREGRPNNRMPSFNFSNQEVAGLIAFIRARGNAAALHPGGRRGVSVEDLQTGNVAAGKAYFEGAGGCVKCHSASGDLAGIAQRYEGLQLEMHMLYPRNAKSSVTVTLPSGEKITGTLAYRDEFTIALRDANGQYRSWAVNRVHFTVDDPVQAHVDQFPKYTDEDVHNLMAYLQTLK